MWTRSHWRHMPSNICRTAKLQCVAFCRAAQCGRTFKDYSSFMESQGHLGCQSQGTANTRIIKTSCRLHRHPNFCKYKSISRPVVVMPIVIITQGVQEKQILQLCNLRWKKKHWKMQIVARATLHFHKHLPQMVPSLQLVKENLKKLSNTDYR